MCLEFRDFSFRNDNAGFNTISDEHQKNLLSYLQKAYTVDSMMMSGAWLVLFCKEVPPVDERPFIVAGSVAVWLSDDHDPVPAEIILLGSPGLGAEIEMEANIIKDLEMYRLPSRKTLQAVFEYFETAHHVTFYTTGLVIELPEQSEEDFVEALENLPGGIMKGGITLAYYNGLLAVTEEMRVQRPQPNLTDGRADKLLDIETEARVLLRSSEIQIGDQYFLDEEVKGFRRRMLQCMGIRLRKPSGEAKSLHGGVQGIYAISPAAVESDPNTQGFGSPIVCFKQCRKRDVVEEGGVVGFMQYSEMRPQSIMTGNLLCVCETLDEI
ncbi:MAG: hypothetical protein L6R38_000168 [Xanthoria sp. 2 TBL-2021]|nr:MAG: hypothetical protein L6R38_000168 [Xanthoria sp. 2 TBL-2021]